MLYAGRARSKVAAGWSLSGFAPGRRRRAMLFRRKEYEERKEAIERHESAKGKGS